MKFGVPYRLPLVPWINSQLGQIEALEIVAEGFRFAGEKLLQDLARSYVLTVRTNHISIGTPGPMRESTLQMVSSIVAEASPQYITTPLGFSRSQEADLDVLLPVSLNAESLKVLVDHAFELLGRWQTPLLFENITSDLCVKGRISEPEFVGRLCQATGCGIVLDVTSLLVNGRNHGFDPLAWVRAIDPHKIVQLHVAGYSYRGGRWYDEHLEDVQQDVWDLTRDVLRYTRPVVITLERYGNFPTATEFENEISLLKSAADATSTPS